MTRNMVFSRRGDGGIVVTMERPESWKLMELIRITGMTDEFKRAKCPMRDTDEYFSFENVTEDPGHVVLDYPMDKWFTGDEVISFISSVDDAVFSRHSKVETIDRLERAFVPGSIDGDFRGCPGIEDAVDDANIFKIMVVAFQPASSMKYTSVSTSTVEVDDQRMFNVYYRFRVIVTNDVMIDWLVHGGKGTSCHGRDSNPRNASATGS